MNYKFHFYQNNLNDALSPYEEIMSKENIIKYLLDNKQQYEDKLINFIKTSIKRINMDSFRDFYNEHMSVCSYDYFYICYLANVTQITGMKSEKIFEDQSLPYRRGTTNEYTIIYIDDDEIIKYKQSDIDIISISCEIDIEDGLISLKIIDIA